MTPCTPFQENLKAYADRELSLFARLKVKRHVESCPACQEEIQEMELIRKHLRPSKPGALTPELKAKLLSSLPEGVPPGKILPLRRLSKPALVFGGLATLLIVSTMAPFLKTATEEGAMQETAKSQVAQANPVSPSNLKQIGVASQMYTQDYDAATTSSKSMTPRRPAPPVSTTTRTNGGDKVAQGARDRKELSVNSPELSSVDSDGIPPEAAKMMRGARAGYGARMSNGSEPGLTDYGRFRADRTLISTDRDVHREATLNVQVDNAETRSDAVETMTKETGGYVAETNLNTESDGTKTAQLTLKIPVDKFETFLASVGKLGEVKSKNITGEDLTEQIGDEKSGKRVLADEVEELKAQLRKHNTGRSQERQAREDLRDLKTRIAIKQARLETYRKMASLSTVTLTLSEKPKKKAAVVTPGTRSEFGGMTAIAGAAFLQAMKLPLFLLIWIAAYSPLWIPLLLGYRYYSKKTVA